MSRAAGRFAAKGRKRRKRGKQFFNPRPRRKPGEPELTDEEEAELVERINANPNLHPLGKGEP